MSTTMYLKCLSHDPPIWSDELGQHTYDLKDIQGYVKNKDLLIAVLEADYTLDGGNPNWLSAAAWFLRGHAKCELQIVDEYGKTYPLQPEGE